MCKKKRLMIGLVVAGLVTIFIAGAANATIFRVKRTVDNIHDCRNSAENCKGAVSVTDRLYGAEKVTVAEGEVCPYFSLDGECYKPTCEMKGTLICQTESDCGVVNETPVALTQLSFQSEAFFGIDEKATGITFLDTTTGENACSNALEGSYIDYLPDAIVALSSYYTNPSSSTFYEIIEVCPKSEPALYGDTFVCDKVWDSKYAAVRPNLPCCGELNTLTVKIEGSGKVTSDDGKIDCLYEDSPCTGTYDSIVPPGDSVSPDPDACPSVLLTATPAQVPGANYVFTGWSDNCTPVTENTCTVAPATPAALVTATFESDSFLLTVRLNGLDSNDRVRIFSPSGIFFRETSDNVCDLDVCTVWVDAGVTVVLKKQGDSIEWGGYCSGVPNDNLNCAVPMTGPQEAIVYFDGVPE